MAKKEIDLQDGDVLKIAPEVKSFLFKCCDCGLVHKIEIEKEKNDIKLKFFREKKS